MGQTVSLCGNLWFAWLSGTINTQVQRLFLKCRPAAPTRTRHVPGHTPCSQRVHSPGPQGRRTACLQPPVGAGVQPRGNQGPGSPRTRASGLSPARGLEPGLHTEVLSRLDSGAGCETEAAISDRVAVAEPGLQRQAGGRSLPGCVGLVLQAPALSACRKRPCGQVSACTLPQQDPRAMAWP